MRFLTDSVPLDSNFSTSVEKLLFFSLSPVNTILPDVLRSKSTAILLIPSEFIFFTAENKGVGIFVSEIIVFAFS